MKHCLKRPNCSISFVRGWRRSMFFHWLEHIQTFLSTCSPSREIWLLKTSWMLCLFTVIPSFILVMNCFWHFWSVTYRNATEKVNWAISDSTVVSWKSAHLQNGIVQSVMCHLDSTLKPLVVLLYNYLLGGHQSAVNMTWALFHGITRKYNYVLLYMWLAYYKLAAFVAGNVTIKSFK